jgi:hypothetical protein
MELVGQSVSYLSMVDCDKLSCPEFIEGYPTWALINDGQVIEVRVGIQSIENLEVMAR